MAGALGNGLYLRLPGQWDDGTWTDATSGARIYYSASSLLAVAAERVMQHLRRARQPHHDGLA